MADIQDLRLQIDQALQEGLPAVALEGLKQLWRTHPVSSTPSYILSRRERFGELAQLRACRVAILRSFTVEPVVPFLCAGAFLQGIDVTVYTGPFNAYAQEMFDPTSPLYAFAPDVAILAVQTRDLLPQFWEGFTDLSPEDVRDITKNALEQIGSWLMAFRKHSNAHLIVHTLECPATPSQGILDYQVSAGQVESIYALNQGLRRLAAQFHSVHLLDYEGLISRHGRDNWHDPLKWLTTRLPIATGCIRYLANEWLRFIYGIAGTVRKVLVTDLDNTLWGGLAGEEGVEGVKLGREYPGAGYQNLQRAMLDLHRRGILLAISSKNNESDAIRIIETHPEMLLRPEHFAVMKINWRDKAQNLREIASELNLGTESLVFVDDNPVERERIRREMPEVEVIELPTNPMAYDQAVKDSPVFERLTLTAEDRVRTQQYREQRGRVELAQAATSLEEFYWSLRQIVKISPAEPNHLARIAQLTQKTNQFNVTTKRYREEQVREIVAAPDCQLYAIQVEDRFGDNGIVGVVITRTNVDACEIDTFLMSCRVIGRTVETAVMSFIVAESARRGLAEVRGVFVPTKKNAPAAGLFKDHNFVEAASCGEETRWILELSGATIACPAWIEVQFAKDGVLTEYAAF